MFMRTTRLFCPVDSHNFFNFYLSVAQLQNTATNMGDENAPTKGVSNLHLDETTGERVRYLVPK